MSCNINLLFPNLNFKKYPCPRNPSNDVSIFITNNKPPVYNGRSILELYETFYLITQYIPGPYQGIFV